MTVWHENLAILLADMVGRVGNLTLEVSALVTITMLIMTNQLVIPGSDQKYNEWWLLKTSTVYK